MVTVKRMNSTVEIHDLDDLYRVVKEARAQEEPLIIETDDGDEIAVNPAPRRARRRTMEARTQADEEAFLSSFGSWQDHLDPDEFIRQVSAGRGSSRPFVEITVPEE